MQRITEPSQLADMAEQMGISEFQDSSDATWQPIRLNLALLQPLAKPDMLSSCRNPASRVMHDQYGAVCGPSNLEFLNFRPLNEAWRHAVRAVPAISHVIFDLTLPEYQGTKEFPRLYWDARTSSDGGLAILTRDVIILVSTIATVITMRTRAPLQFEIVYDPSDGTDTSQMEQLAGWVHVLAERKNMQ